eukprot:1158484-Pelagomonas_calceolata.AAC.17
MDASKVHNVSELCLHHAPLVCAPAQVYLALCPDVGGNLKASYEEVVAKLARTKVRATYGCMQQSIENTSWIETPK